MLNIVGSSRDDRGIIALLHSAHGVRFILASLASIDNMGILQSANSDQLLTCSQLLLVQNRSSA